MDLEAKYGIRTAIAEIITSPPSGHTRPIQEFLRHICVIPVTECKHPGSRALGTTSSKR
jgi:hypothetical protein